MRKIDFLYKKYCESKTDKIISDDIKDISDINTGYYDFKGDSIVELSSWLRKYLARFGIGKKISRKYWGDRKTTELQQTLYDTLKPTKDDRVYPTKSKFQIMDDLQKDVRSKNHTTKDFARIARTEAAALKAIFQLESWKKAGIVEVRHKNNAGSVSRKTVGKRDRLFNNRVFKIDYLLSKAGEKDRIPLHPSCMCRYEMVMPK